MRKLKYENVIKKIFNFCRSNGVEFLFVSGNGGAGKSTFAKRLKEEFEKNNLTANLLDTDDFLSNTTIRRNSSHNYLDRYGYEHEGTWTYAYEESYHLGELLSTIYNLSQKLDIYHAPRKYKDESDFVLLKGNADIHIVEGVCTQLIKKPKNCLSVYLKCNVELEAKRKISRARNGEEKMNFVDVVNECQERRDQIDAMEMIKSFKFDLVLRSNEDFSFALEKDVFNVIGSGSMNKDCDFAINAIKQASALLVNDFDTIDKGNSGDIVTSLDLNIEKYLINKVRKKYPNHKIISEEFYPDNKIEKNCVIINGIDGSVNVSKMMPIFGIQLAINTNGECVAAVCYLPFLNELYYCDETTSYCNSKKITVKDCPIEKGLIAATGTKRIEKIVKLKDYGLILRDYGSIAVAFSWVASGKLQGAIYNGDKIWNYYPVLKICERAGAKIIDKHGVHMAASGEEFSKILSK